MSADGRGADPGRDPCGDGSPLHARGDDGREVLPAAAVKVFPARTSAVAAARAWACEQATRYGWDGLRDVVELLISEIVTNAVRHTRSTTVVVHLQAYDELEAAVYDTSVRPPQLRPAQDWDENGRGLAVVQALADEWGTQQLPDGKCVWFRLRNHQA